MSLPAPIRRRWYIALALASFVTVASALWIFAGDVGKPAVVQMDPVTIPEPGNPPPPTAATTTVPATTTTTTAPLSAEQVVVRVLGAYLTSEQARANACAGGLCSDAFAAELAQPVVSGAGGFAAGRIVSVHESKDARSADGRERGFDVIVEQAGRQVGFQVGVVLVGRDWKVSQVLG